MRGWFLNRFLTVYHHCLVDYWLVLVLVLLVLLVLVLAS
jgi:hypothetical protein